jgi:hypothetical protein
VTFLFLSFLAVSAPFAVERFYFQIRLGIFAILFWLFIFQIAVMFAGDALLASEIDLGLPEWFALVGKAVGTIVFLTSGITPIVAIALSAIFLVVAAVSKVSKCYLEGTRR